MTLDRRLGVSGGTAFKAPCRVATTANITLSGLQTIDGVTVVADDRVLVKNQTDGVENGIYIADTSTWERAPDFDGTRDAVQGTLVMVVAGTVGASTVFQLSTASPVIGTSSLTFAVTGAAALALASAFMLTVLDDTTAAAARTTLGAAGLTGDETIAGIKTFTGANAHAGIETFNAAVIFASLAKLKHGADIASAATLDLSAATGNLVDVTGTTGITAITLAEGDFRVVRFTGALVLTHGASLVLPNNGNSITTTAGDCAIFFGYAAGVVRCIAYTPITGSLLATPVVATYTSNADLATLLPGDDTIPQIGEGTQIFSQAYTAKAAARRVKVRCEGFFSSATSADQMGMALFIDGAADAVRSAFVTTSGANAPLMLALEYEAVLAAGAHTFTVRVGGNGRTLRANGSSAARYGGGTAATILRIEEAPAP